MTNLDISKIKYEMICGEKTNITMMLMKYPLQYYYLLEVLIVDWHNISTLRLFELGGEKKTLQTSNTWL